MLEMSCSGCNGTPPAFGMTITPKPVGNGGCIAVCMPCNDEPLSTGPTRTVVFARVVAVLGKAETLCGTVVATLTIFKAEIPDSGGTSDGCGDTLIICGGCQLGDPITGPAGFCGMPSIVAAGVVFLAGGGPGLRAGTSPGLGGRGLNCL
jgi:hypothetical protein